MTAAISELAKRCRCEVSVTVNEHRNYYQSVAHFLAEFEPGTEPEIADDIKQRMMETDTVVRVQFYPRTPIGFYSIYHFSIDAALREAIDGLNFIEGRR